MKHQLLFLCAFLEETFLLNYNKLSCIKVMCAYQLLHYKIFSNDLEIFYCLIVALKLCSLFIYRYLFEFSIYLKNTAFKQNIFPQMLNNWFKNNAPYFLKLNLVYSKKFEIIWLIYIRYSLHVLQHFICDLFQ